ncbi:unannotated protein [freshwater metagenome]|jgi:glycopeptide antibiotics resistance protein|uniref:Unannotated protein n=1 Tax=freshwater metagenome TaxID=449393 RepID=A0A6J7GGJ9_9ZZZZ|nr:DUF2530 domain-containing protein [Actinomycetota bacterium]MSW23478.1 DUF2530 domain-containing protein [Actinomycetota bacterium]MSW75716.1 DUF2530 domain-containing protein [Actinomycetota bacterium]MSY20842.1 DUF2530 domain-containing protein [Actinomycetota bacterium]MSY30393.1 DUF2530 domain-containing protein [Actinomycetota bacterium]
MEAHVKSVVTLISAGIALWIIGFVVCLAIGADAKVLWTCVMGVLLGLIGIRYTIRRARKSGI